MTKTIYTIFGVLTAFAWTAQTVVVVKDADVGTGETNWTSDNEYHLDGYVFVPSGGGQWVIQGPVVCQAALALDVPVPKIIMALAYGDQITNMLQPFWALPLLGITQLKAKDILPFAA